jgi:hypothetical protein
MTTSTHLHRSTAYVKAITERGRTWKPDPITRQFRFIVRMAYACRERQVPYDLAWIVQDRTMHATITATRAIPNPKPLPKPPKPKVVSDWKPSIWDEEYRLDAYQDANRNRKCPGFVIEHSCGLSLVHRPESGELGVTEHGENEDVRQNWLLTHTASGWGSIREGCHCLLSHLTAMIPSSRPYSKFPFELRMKAAQETVRQVTYARLKTTLGDLPSSAIAAVILALWPLKFRICN